jgi:succinoglycan biosynthesis transport protein ExoP
MTPNQLFRILWARRIVVAIGIAVLAGTALLVSLIVPRQYAAVAEVIIDMRSPDPVMGTAVPQQAVQGMIATQVEILESERVARAVVDALGLDKSPRWLELWQKETGGAKDLRGWITPRLQKGLDVRSSREGNIVRVGYTATDPHEAARIANAFAAAYLEISVALRVEPARQNAAFFDERLAAARLEVERAQAKLSAYQRDKRIVSGDDRLDIEQTRLAALSAQLATMQGAVVDSRSRNVAASGRASAEGLADVLESRLVQKLRGDLSDAEARLQRMRLALGEAHPDVQRTESEIASIKSRLDAEVDRYAQGVRTTGAINERRLQEVTRALEEQRAKVLQLRGARAELGLLEDEVLQAKRNLETVSQRLVTTTMESQNRQTNSALLTAATPPVDPSSPKLAINVAGGVLFGMLLGSAIALAMEHRSRPVRSVVDLVEVLQVPVLVVVPGSDSRRRVSTLPRSDGLRPIASHDGALRRIGP